MKAVVDTFVIGEFPQLRLIAWNRNPHKEITNAALGDILAQPVELVRDVRADRYGIRTRTNLR